MEKAREWCEIQAAYYGRTLNENDVTSLATLISEARRAQIEADAKIANRMSKCSDTRAENERAAEIEAAIRRQL